MKKISVAPTRCATAAMADETIPPFDPRGTRFDQSTFSGRLQHFRQMVDPKTLLTSKDELQAAQDLLARHAHGEAAGVTDHELWEAKRVKDAVIHPVTGEEMFLPGRMSAFVPVNTIPTAGMVRPADSNLATPTFNLRSSIAASAKPILAPILAATRKVARGDDLLAMDQPERQCHVQLCQPWRCDHRYLTGCTGLRPCGRRELHHCRRREEGTLPKTTIAPTPSHILNNILALPHPSRSMSPSHAHAARHHAIMPSRHPAHLTKSGCGVRPAVGKTAWHSGAIRGGGCSRGVERGLHAATRDAARRARGRRRRQRARRLEVRGRYFRGHDRYVPLLPTARCHAPSSPCTHSAEARGGFRLVGVDWPACLLASPVISRDLALPQMTSHDLPRSPVLSRDLLCDSP